MGGTSQPGLGSSCGGGGGATTRDRQVGAGRGSPRSAGHSRHCSRAARAAPLLSPALLAVAAAAARRQRCSCPLPGQGPASTSGPGGRIAGTATPPRRGRRPGSRSARHRCHCTIEGGPSGRSAGRAGRRQETLSDAGPPTAMHPPQALAHEAPVEGLNDAMHGAQQHRALAINVTARACAEGEAGAHACAPCSKQLACISPAACVHPAPKCMHAPMGASMQPRRQAGRRAVCPPDHPKQNSCLTSCTRSPGWWRTQRASPQQWPSPPQCPRQCRWHPGARQRRS